MPGTGALMLTGAGARALGAYAEECLAAALAGRALAPAMTATWGPYHALFGKSYGSSPERLLPIAASVVKDRDTVLPDVADVALPRVPLALTEAALFSVATGVTTSPDAWAGARETLAAVVRGLAGVSDAEAALACEPLIAVMQRFGTNLPATLGTEDTLSLFRQFALVSAFFAASDGAAEPAGAFTLVLGDTPGIQAFVGGTGVSKQAAKGLRGRSLFLQLLTDAVARRLLDAFGLPGTNLLYAAGGNFLLLAPADVEERLAGEQAAITRALLETSGGEVAQATAWVRAAAGDLRDETGLERVMRDLRARLAAAKLRPHAAVLAGAATDAETYDRLFGADRRGEPDEASEEEYAALATSLATEGPEAARYLHREWRRDLPEKAKEWQRRLHAVSGGWHYCIDGEARPAGAVATHLTDALNRPEAVPEVATGFRFLAMTTPRGKQGIREVREIADVTPMRRIGVLRMDVDGLGNLFAEGLNPRTLATICTLSAALDTFFAGWLNVLCARAQNPAEEGGSLAPRQIPLATRGDLLYTLYSGGDDLFVVGAWDRLPVLAQMIRADFRRYSAENPAFRVSGGIAIEDEKFPLYQLGQDAAAALDRVKDVKEPLAAPGQQRRGHGKDALALFGAMVPWERYGEVAALVARLIATREEPSALLGRLRDVAILDRKERARLEMPAPDIFGAATVVVGRAQWRGLVALQRAIEQRRAGDPALGDLLRDLKERLLAGGLTPHLPLAARWADYLWRRSNPRRE